LDKVDGVQWERVAFSIGVQSSVITLHRSRFLRHYEDPDYAHAISTSVASADKVLNSLQELERIHFPGRRWWGILLHCYKAAVTLLLDHQHRRAADTSVELADSRISLIRLVIRLLSETAEVIASASKAALVLQHLLDEATLPSHTKTSRVSPIKRPLQAQDTSKTTTETVSLNGMTTSTTTPPGIWKNIFDLELDVEVMDDPRNKSDNIYTTPANVEGDLK